MPGTQLNVNPSRAVIWFVGVTISIVHLLIAIHLYLASFYATKYFWKQLTTVRGMLIEQIFDLRGPGPPGHICTPITGCFHDKTIFSKENIRLDCYSLQKYCKGQCTLLPLPGPNQSQNLIQNAKF